MGIRLEDVSATVKRLESQLRDEYQVQSLYVLGAVARGNGHEANGLDMLVEFEGPGRFTQFLDLKFLLEAECGVPVDLITRAAIPFHTKRARPFRGHAGRVTLRQERPVNARFAATAAKFRHSSASARYHVAHDVANICREP